MYLLLGELYRNAKFLVSPLLLSQRLWGLSPAVRVFRSPPGDSDACSSLRTTGVDTHTARLIPVALLCYFNLS